jgi:hypothetical protein
MPESDVRTPFDRFLSSTSIGWRIARIATIFGPPAIVFWCFFLPNDDQQQSVKNYSDALCLAPFDFGTAHNSVVRNDKRKSVRVPTGDSISRQSRAAVYPRLREAVVNGP